MDTRESVDVLDKSLMSIENISFDMLESSCHLPDFEFSSPISSISSNCSSPDRDHTLQPRALLEQLENHINSSFVSLDELNSQISPPSDGSGSSCSAASSSTMKNIEVLETIFEDCYLETPPGTPSTPRPKKARRLIRLSIARQVEFDEMKENLNTPSNEESQDITDHEDEPPTNSWDIRDINYCCFLPFQSTQRRYMHLKCIMIRDLNNFFLLQLYSIRWEIDKEHGRWKLEIYTESAKQ